MKRYQLCIDGQSADPAGANWFETQSPYTGQAWAEMTATQRALMRKLGDLIARDAAKLGHHRSARQRQAKSKAKP